MLLATSCFHLSTCFAGMGKSQVVPIFYVSLAMAAGFIALPLDASCLGASCLCSPVPGRRLLEEVKSREPNFQADHAAALAQGTTTLPLHSAKIHFSAQRFTLQP